MSACASSSSFMEAEEPRDTGTLLVYPAVGYRIEGGGGGSDESGSSDSSGDKGKAIDDDSVFDYTDNDYKYYKEKFAGKGGLLTQFWFH